MSVCVRVCIHNVCAMRVYTMYTMCLCVCVRDRERNRHIHYLHLKHTHVQVLIHTHTRCNWFIEQGLDDTYNHYAV